MFPPTSLSSRLHWGQTTSQPLRSPRLASSLPSSLTAISANKILAHPLLTAASGAPGLPQKPYYVLLFHPPHNLPGETTLPLACTNFLQTPELAHSLGVS